MMEMKNAGYDCAHLLHSLHWPNDVPAMKKAIEALAATGIRFRRPSEHHLKYEKLNYYPTTMKCFVDGTGKKGEKVPLPVFVQVATRYHLELTGRTRL